MEFNELIKERRSIRKYLPGEDISDETLMELFAGVQLAPSWKNSQTARYYVVRGEEMLDIQKTAMPEFNAVRSRNAAALIVSAFKENISGFTDGKPDNQPANHWGAHDLGLANAYLVLNAKNLGYDTLIMGLRDEELIRNKLCIPEDEMIMAIIAIGKRDGEAVFKPRIETEEIVRL